MDLERSVIQKTTKIIIVVYCITLMGFFITQLRSYTLVDEGTVNVDFFNLVNDRPGKLSIIFGNDQNSEDGRASTSYFQWYDRSKFDGRLILYSQDDVTKNWNTLREMIATYPFAYVLKDDASERIIAGCGTPSEYTFSVKPIKHLSTCIIQGRRGGYYFYFRYRGNVYDFDQIKAYTYDKLSQLEEMGRLHYLK